MIYGGTISKGGQTVSAYATCDPRVLYHSHKQVAGTSEGQGREVSRSSDGSRESAIDPSYRKIQSFRGKQRINQFDYKALNVRSVPA